MSCRHLSMHGCNFESDRRRIVGSSSSIARGALGSYGDRTQGNRANSGGEVVHRLLLGLKCGAPAPAGEQLRTTYTERHRLGSAPQDGRADRQRNGAGPGFGGLLFNREKPVRVNGITTHLHVAAAGDGRSWPVAFGARRLCRVARVAKAARAARAARVF